MYEKFYNLKEEPFHITPDLRFLYLSETHKHALSSIIYGVQKREGFMAITGAVGVGKTTIVRAFLEKATSAGLKVIHVVYGNLTFKDLLKTMYKELELELATDDLLEMVSDLHIALIALHRQGKTVVLIIDEAQTMPIDTLENLRILSNLETPTEKLIQVVLVGQTELEELLEKHELRQLKQRIAIRSQIAPLNPLESYSYIVHRLSVAGLDTPTILSKKALNIIIREAKGVPRRLNVLCNNALITGYRQEKNPVTASIARKVVRDFGVMEERLPVRKWKVAALAGVALFLALVVAFSLSPLRHDAAQMLGDIGLWQPARPERVSAPVRRLPTEQPPVAPVLTPAPSLEPQGAVEPPAAAKPKAPITRESAIQPKEIADRKRGVAAASYQTRVVKPGESLSRLIREVYGISPKASVERSLIDLVKQHNPEIKDPNLVLVGSVIRFPEPPKSK